VRTFDHRDFPVERLRDARDGSVAVCVPARECATTIARVTRELVALREAGAIDRVVVLDAHSVDGTGAIARRAGAEVVQQAELLAESGPVQGKGDAMWRALSVVTEDVVCFVDGDSTDFGPHFVCGLVGPLVCRDGVEYVKGFYRRPWRDDTGVKPSGGGRVTELTARPLLGRFYPELLAFEQPLAGEMAARRTLFEAVPFAAGYGLEIGLLIDVHRLVGLAAMCQVDLDSRQNRHRPLEQLGPMADAVLEAVAARLTDEGRLSATPAVRLERPPLARVRTAV